MHWFAGRRRNRPRLAPELLRDALHVELPKFTEARIDSADLTDIQPAEYRADLVVLLLNDKRVLGIVVEAQLSAASLGLDEDRSQLYFDLILMSLSEAARRELKAMDPAKYEYQSEFAKRYVAQGQAEGCAKGERSGREALVIRQLTVRFGALTEEARARIASSSIEELDAIGERLLTAQTLREAID